jgi:hypothetical protein
MTSPAIRAIVELASEPLGGALPSAGSRDTRVPPELATLLVERNGFFAFESALLVLPDSTSAVVPTLDEWNDARTWKSEYDSDMVDGHVFFAMDAFGGQFALNNGRVHAFDIETGASTPVADDVSDWARLVLEDYDYLTGHSPAHEWQARHGGLPPRQRLFPTRPFVMGGDYSVENLVAFDMVKGLQGRGQLARQLRDVPDGASVELRLV